MVEENINYINIRSILDEVSDHPMLREHITLEKCIRLTLKFIAKVGVPKFYLDKQTSVPIHEYRGILPCDIVSIIQVRDNSTGVCMHSMTDSFLPGQSFQEEVMNRVDASFKTQGRIIYTSFREGEVEIAYRAIPVDNDGLPLLPDNEVFKEALVLFIKKKIFGELFDQGKINISIKTETDKDYAFAVGQCTNDFLNPNESEMQSIINQWTSLIPRTREFIRGNKFLGTGEHLKF